MVADMNPVKQHKNPPMEDDALLVKQAIAPLFYPKPALYDWNSADYIPMLAESVDVDDQAKTLTFVLRQGVEWTDGESVTATDLAGTFKLAWALADSSDTTWPYVDEITVVDERTVELALSKVFEGVAYKAATALVHSYARYGEFMDRAGDLMSKGSDFWGSDEQTAFTSELSDLSFEDWVSCGPFRFQEQSDNLVVFELHEEGLFGDKVKFQEVAARVAGNTDILPFLRSGEIDYATNVLTPNDREAVMELDGVVELEHANYSGGGIALNNNRHGEFADVRVRKAMLHAIDRDAVAEAAVGSYGYTENHYDSGYSVLHTEEILSDTGELVYYEYDVDKAAGLMEEAGWSKDGGSWSGPDGKAKKYTLIAPEGWTDWTDAATAIAAQLQDFGLDVEFNPVPQEDFLTILPSGEYDMAIRQWGSTLRPMPSGAAEWNFFYENLRTKGEPGMGVETEGIETEAFGKVSVDEIYQDAFGSEDYDEMLAANGKIALIFNEYLPRLPIWEGKHTSRYRIGLNIGSVEVDDDYADNNPTLDNQLLIALLQGKVTPA